MNNELTTSGNKEIEMIKVEGKYKPLIIETDKDSLRYFSDLMKYSKIKKGGLIDLVA